MRVIRAPLRVSLFGGGCDLPEYYTRYGATIISMAISRYMYLVHNPRPTGGYRLTYSDVEELSSLTTAKHTIISRAAMDYGELEPCTLSIISDVPKGTGLGSSSALAVCVDELFRRNRDGHQAETAHAAYQLERQVSNCGVQDHLPAAWGGFRVYTIDKEGRATSELVPDSLAEIVETYGLLLYTGHSRPADAILKTWKKSETDLHCIHNLALHFATSRLNETSPATIGALLDQTWEFKREIGGVASPELVEQYRQARDAGALGGKLLGAGGGGCWFFLVHANERQAVIDALGLVEIPFRIESRGVKDVYC